MRSTGRQMKPRVGSGRVIGAWPSRRRAARCSPRYLFDAWGRVSARLRAAKHVVLFLDFDGTLAPFEADPQGVWLDAETRRLLDKLARRLKVFVISGRRRSDLRRRVKVSGVEYLGLYGWEGPKAGWIHSRNGKLADGARRLAEARLQRLPGIRIEDKGPLFTVHYRGAPPRAVRQAKVAIRKILEPRKPGLRLMTNKRAWEILPEDFKDKGAAVELLMRDSPPGALAVYFGDDGPDEAAFRVLQGGVTVRVGKRSLTAARFYVRNSAEVKRILGKLEEAIA